MQILMSLLAFGTTFTGLIHGLGPSIFPMISASSIVSNFISPFFLILKAEYLDGWITGCHLDSEVCFH